MTEEPYPTVVSASGDTLNQFTCQIFGPREGGRYNLSVALLGQVGPAWGPGGGGGGLKGEGAREGARARGREQG